jgi:DNA-binding winged helix-turn-helix (wHTH) protein/tetratricopeptide (TPR) repeat protein
LVQRVPGAKLFLREVFALDSQASRPAEYRFEAFRLNLKTSELTKLGTRIRLQGQPLQILIMLLEQPGQVISRDFMKERLWPADTFVDFEHSLNTAIKKLRQTLGDSATESRYIETLPRVGYRFLPKVDEIAETVRPSVVATSGKSSPEPIQDRTLHPSATDAFGRLRLVRYVILPLLAASIVFALSFSSVRGRVFGLLGRSGKTPSAVGASSRPRSSIAILGFKNTSGRPDEEWLSTAFSEMLTTELGAGGRLIVIPGENIARMKTDLALPDEAIYTPESLKRIHGNLGADMVVLGSYTALGEKSGGQIRLDLRLQDAATGETSAILSATGTEAKLFDLVTDAGEQLRAKVGVGAVPSSESATVQASLPGSLQAEQLYSQGLDRLRSYDSLAARPILERAVQADPKFALAHSALSQAWMNLGYEMKAREEAKQALDLSASLPKERQLIIEGRYRSSTNEWKKAIDAYQELYSLYPDNMEYGLQLATAKIFGRKAKDAISLLESFRTPQLPPAFSPRVSLELSFARQAISDIPTSLAEARKAEEGGRFIGAKELEAQAWHVEATGLIHSGELDKAIVALGQAKKLFESIGSKSGVARVQSDLAEIYQDRGDFQTSLQMYEDSLAVFRSIGDESFTIKAMADIASVLRNQGDLSGAKKMYLDALAESAKTGSRHTNTRFELATVLLDQGDLTAAKPIFDEMLAASGSAGDKFGVSLSQAEIARILFAQGKISDARKLFEESLNTTRAIGDDGDTLVTLQEYATLLLAQNNLPAAHKSVQEAIDIAQKLNEKIDAAQAQSLLAEILLEEGNLPQAEALARQSSDALANQKSHLPQGVADSILSITLLSQGNLPAAQKTSAQADILGGKTQILEDRLAISIRSARVLAASGHPDDALQKLADVLREAKHAGTVPGQLAVQLAINEIAWKSSKSAKNRSQLAAFSRDASSKGFMLVANKSQSLLAGKN